MLYVSRSASDPNLHKRRSRKGESSIFKTVKVKKLQKYCKIYKTFEIFATWYFCFQKYCLILKTFELFRMWAALPVIPTYTRGGRGEGGVSELHNPTKLFHHFTETSSSPKTILLEIRLLMHWYFIAKNYSIPGCIFSEGFCTRPSAKQSRQRKNRLCNFDFEFLQNYKSKLGHWKYGNVVFLQILEAAGHEFCNGSEYDLQHPKTCSQTHKKRKKKKKNYDWAGRRWKYFSIFYKIHTLLHKHISSTK